MSENTGEDNSNINSGNGGNNSNNSNNSGDSKNGGQTWGEWMKQQWYWILPLLLLIIGLVVAAIVWSRFSTSPVLTATSSVPLNPPVAAPSIPVTQTASLVDDATFTQYQQSFPSSRAWTYMNLNYLKLPQGQVVATPVLPPQL